MNGALWVIASLSTVVASVALWHSLRLARQVRELKRNRYYVEQKLNGMTRQVTEALDPMRIQLAAAAAGMPVSQQLIRQGRLYHDVTAEEAEQLIGQVQDNNPDSLMIVDVRTAKEYAVRHLPGAKLIPIEELDTRFPEEVPLSASKVIVYCAEGNRSRLACDYLSRQGYLNLYNMYDGLQGWKGSMTGEPPVNFIQIQSKSSVR